LASSHPDVSSVEFSLQKSRKEIIVTNGLLVAAVVILAKPSYDSIFAYTM
jgi:hypothetical protein